MNRHRSIQRELAALASSTRPAPLSDELQAHLHACAECRAHFTAWQELSHQILTASPVNADSVPASAVHSLHRRLQQAFTEPPQSVNRFHRRVALCAAFLVALLLTLSALLRPARSPLQAPLPPPTYWTYTTASPEELDRLLEQHGARLLPPSTTPIPYALPHHHL